MQSASGGNLWNKARATFERIFIIEPDHFDDLLRLSLNLFGKRRRFEVDSLQFLGHFPFSADFANCRRKGSASFQPGRHLQT